MLAQCPCLIINKYLIVVIVIVALLRWSWQLASTVWERNREAAAAAQNNKFPSINSGAKSVYVSAAEAALFVYRGGSPLLGVSRALQWNLFGLVGRGRLLLSRSFEKGVAYLQLGVRLVQESDPTVPPLRTISPNNTFVSMTNCLILYLFMSFGWHNRGKCLCS